MKVAIVGSRSFSDYDEFLRLLGRFDRHDFDEIVSGGASGADSLAERFANFWKIPFRKVKPNWGKHGRSAGFQRDAIIISSVDMVIAFWDGKSKGTENDIELSRKFRKDLILFFI